MTVDFDYTIEVNEYGFYCVPKSYEDRQVPKILYKSEVYEPNTIKLLRRCVGQGSIIAGGAFVGDFLPALSRVLVDGSTLFTFEPNPTSLAASQKTIALNKLRNVSLAPVAVGSASGKLPLQVVLPDGNAAAARTKIVNERAEGTTVDVDVVRLDELIPEGEKITVLQLDIEGHEQPALEGAIRIIKENAPLIVLEAPRPMRRRKFHDWLSRHFPEHDYQICGVMERNVFFMSIPKS